MKKLIVCLLMSVMVGCVSHPEQPGRVESVILDDGREVLLYVPGYSIEDFLQEWHN